LANNAGIKEPSGVIRLELKKAVINETIAYGVQVNKNILVKIIKLTVIFLLLAFLFPFFVPAE